MKISIITPSYNRVEMIEIAIKSVLDQNFSEVEHIVMDGGSVDGTLEVLKKYPHLRFESAPDLGMYDAINKGLDLATGEIIGFLNTDDSYAPGALQAALTVSTADPEADVAWGSSDMIKMTPGGGKITTFLRPPIKDEEIVPYLLIEIPIFNACFFRKQVFERWGLLNAQLKIAGDREFMLRVALEGGKFHTTDAILYHYFAHDNSMTYGNNPTIFEQWNMEHCQIAEYQLAQHMTQGKARAAYWRMHTNSNLSLIKIACKRGNFLRAIGLALQGWQVNPRWPLIFLNRWLKILSNLLLRGDFGDSIKR